MTTPKLPPTPTYPLMVQIASWLRAMIDAGLTIGHLDDGWHFEGDPVAVPGWGALLKDPGDEGFIYGWLEAHNTRAIVYVGRLPFGNYTITAVETSPAKAKDALRRTYRQMQKDRVVTTTPFEEYWEDAGGYVSDVTLGDVEWL